MKRTLNNWILIVAVAFGVIAPEKALASGACTCARINDWADCGCRKSRQKPGDPPSGAKNGGSNKANCPPCETAHGMPQWWVSQPYISLFATDEPLSYFTSSGQEFTFRWSYKQRFDLPSPDQIPNYYNTWSTPDRFGQDKYLVSYRGIKSPTNSCGFWTHNWQSDIVFWDANWETARKGIMYSGGYEALVFGADGSVSYFYVNLNGQTCLTNKTTGVILKPLSNYPVINTQTADSKGISWGDTTSGFALLYPDGSQDTYSYPYLFSGDQWKSTARAFLTQRIDPQGRVTRIGYENGSYQDCLWGYLANAAQRVRYVVDPDGRTNSFAYAPKPYPLMVTQVTDPYGRNATFGYEAWDCPNSGQLPNVPRLTSITDAVGISNVINYLPGSSNWLASIVTPYGTTGFNYYQQTDSSLTNGVVERLICVSEPNGAHQVYYYKHNDNNNILSNSATPPSVPGQVFDAGLIGGAHSPLRYRNSFHWDRRQCENLNGGLINSLAIGSPLVISNTLSTLTASDFRKASMKHWLMASDTNSLTELISSQRDASPDGAGQIDGNRTWYAYANTDFNFPEKDYGGPVTSIARILADGRTNYTVYNYTDSTTTGLPMRTDETYTLANGSTGVRSTYYNYSGNGIDLLTVSNSAGQSLTYSYNGYHQVTNTADALGQQTKMGWDATSKNLTSIRLPSGQTISLAYYDYMASNSTVFNMSMLQQVDYAPEGKSVWFTNYMGGLSTVVQQSGATIPTLAVTNTWDGLNRLTSTRYPNGTVSNVYTNLDLMKQQDRMGNWTYFGYDAFQHLTSITNALNNVTSFSWCDCGALESITDAGSNTTTFFYNNQGFLTDVIGPDSSITYLRDLDGRMTDAVDGSTRSVHFDYNIQGLQTKASTAAGVLWQTLFDSADRPLLVTDANNLTTTNTYDLVNRLIMRSWSSGGTEGFTYSTNGLTAYTNVDAKVTSFSRDNAARLTAITNANLEVTRFSYDALNHVTTMVDGLNHTNIWQYNAFGWLTNKADSLTTVIQYSYNRNGWATNRWTPAKGNVGYVFDAMGNLKSAAYSNIVVGYWYDSLNRLTNMTDGSGTTLFGYTSGGELQSEDGPWGNDVLTYAYNQGYRTNINLQGPISWNQSYSYNTNFWRLLKLTSPAGSFGYAFNPSSASALPIGISLPNGTSISNHYNAMGTLDSTALLDQWGHVLDGYAYQNDLMGLRTNLTRQLGIATNTVSIGYDNIGQLTQWTGKESSGALRLNEQLGYGYDAAGNLRYRTNNALIQTFSVSSVNGLTNVTRSGTLTISGATPAPATVTVNSQTAQANGDLTFAKSGFSPTNGANTFTIAAQNAYGSNATSILAVNLPVSVVNQFDANGNLTNDGTRAFFYDADNQLTNVTVAGQWRAEFVYDGLGRRRISRDYAWQSSQWIKTNEIRYIYDGRLVVQERDSSNVPVLTYTRGLDLSASFTGAGGIGGLLARSDANGSAYFHNDGAGNITSLIDSNARIVARYEYDPYGRQLGKWGRLADANRYRFSSKEVHPNSGLSYYGYRFYDPNFQRWINRDPIGEAGGLNLYSFVGNSPIQEIDTFGLERGYGNPVSGPSGPVGPSDPYSTGVSYYPDGNQYKYMPPPPLISPPSVDPFPKEPGWPAFADFWNKYIDPPSPEGFYTGMLPMPHFGGKKPCPKTYQTYTKPHPTEKPYSGRTSGTGTPEQNIAKRDSGHHMNDKGYGPAQLDKSSSNPDAIRGREQQLIDANGGAQSTGGTSGNPINGVAPSNPKKQNYIDSANKEFGT